MHCFITSWQLQWGQLYLSQSGLCRIGTLHFIGYIFSLLQWNVRRQHRQHNNNSKQNVEWLTNIWSSFRNHWFWFVLFLRGATWYKISYPMSNLRPSGWTQIFSTFWPTVKVIQFKALGYNCGLIKINTVNVYPKIKYYK